MNNVTIIIYCENKPGVLFRIANLFLRRKVNIESLTVSELKNEDRSRFTIVVKQDLSLVQKIAGQLEKIIEVSEVIIHTDDQLIYKEAALIKISSANITKFEKAERLIDQCKATIIYREEKAVIVQKIGSEQDIDFLISALESLGLKEVVRSGRIALHKGKSGNAGISNAILKDASRTTNSIGISAIKEIELLAKSQKDVISLAQGTPDFLTEDSIKLAAKKAMDAGLTDKYTAGFGIFPLREALARKITDENKIKTAPEQVIVTHGGIEALMAIFMALLNVEDEVLVLSPDYASHITQIILATHGGRPVFVPLIETGNEWILDPQRLEEAVTPRSKAILICNPCNPTGKVYTKQELEWVAKIALKYNLYIITDEMYEKFVYDGREHLSIGSFKEVAERTISVFGFSKAYSMTGWRIGYFTASKNLVDQIFKIHDSLITCPTVISQYAALEAITGRQDMVAYYKKEYIKRRQTVIDYLERSDKLTYTIPQAAYYVFPKFKNEVLDREIVLRMLKEAKVAVVPGSAFGKGGESHIRISFACNGKNLEEGMERFMNFVEKKV